MSWNALNHTWLLEYAKCPDMEIKDIRPSAFKNSLHSMVIRKGRLVPFEDGEILGYKLIGIQESVE
jgi:hypothetical protein